MRKSVFLLSIVLIMGLGGCSLVKPFHPTIEQGNLFTQQLVNQLRPGMSKNRVRALLGNTVMVDTFNTDRWEYVYTKQTGDGPRTERKVLLYFKNSKLVRFDSDFKPQAKPKKA